jgi:hypothetical protein
MHVLREFVLSNLRTIRNRHPANTVRAMEGGGEREVSIRQLFLTSYQNLEKRGHLERESMSNFKGDRTQIAEIIKQLYNGT